MQKLSKKTLTKIVLIGIIFLVFPFNTNAVSQGDIESFNIESNYDIYSRNKVDAVLHRITNKIYFYIEKDWWEKLNQEERSFLNNRLYNLGAEFEYNIHPEMTSFFGPKPDHLADDSGKITILFHQMSSGAGGYFNSGDQYLSHQYSRSNERNMIYISTNFMDSPMLEGFLAHEFMHMITFNIKEKEHKVREEVWLNEFRAEYMPTFFDYNGEEGNNVLRRKNAFIRYPENSLTEWLGRTEDYGSINMFVHYLVDHYGEEILKDSLNSEKIGIESINEALEKNGYREDFSQVFTDWTIAVLVNDCSLGEKYCYKNEDLKDLKIAPLTSYLSSNHGSSFASRRGIKNWAGNWFRVVGGSGDLAIEFEGDERINFRVPYVLCDMEDLCQVNFINLGNNNKGLISIDDFNTKYSSLTIIPSAQNKTSGFNGSEPSVYFSWNVLTSTKKELTEDEAKEALTNRLLAQIKDLKEEIARLQSLISARSELDSCKINLDLYFGLRRNEVKCLQIFLNEEGVYPEGLITGNFLNLTRQAVVRFQERHAETILHPLGLSEGTGYVGIRTREKMNEILNAR